MPRLEDQSIPSIHAANYHKVLGITKYDNTFYGSHPSARYIAAARQSYRRAGNTMPSDAQLLQRAYFKMGTEAMRSTTENERAAYYDLSLGSGMYYYNWFMQRNILAFMGGATIPQILRPYAARFNLAGNPPCAHMEIVSPVGAGGTFRWDVENRPATEIATCSEIRFYQFQLVIFGRLWTNGTYNDTPQAHYDLTGPRQTGSLYVAPFAPPPRYQRVARIWRHSDTPSPCIVWRFTFEDAMPELSLSGFLNT